ncbi:MAG: serpin family protein [Eubacterium sp.]|nr:serpin family protein [Eubacterium sp.]
MTIKDYTGKYNELTRQWLESFVKAKKGRNIVFSPLSILMLLGIAADAVRGEARDEITAIIGNSASYDDLMGVLSFIQKDSDKSGSLMSSNAVCIKENIQAAINADYAERLESVFDGQLFSSSNLARDVNAWVEEKTRGMIRNAVDNSVDQMLACLMNAIAFEAEWKKQYQDDEILEGEFNNADGSVSLVQMLDSCEHAYIENERFTGFIKPYKDEKYAFMALLPKRKAASFMLSSLKQIDFTRLFREASHARVYVTMPEFKYDFGQDLTGSCRDLGIKTLFTTKADFSPMSSQELQVESIFHKAHIEVDRKGTKAAAVTMAITVGCALPMDYKSVYLDRPFVYAIMDTETGLPVFTGILNQAGR